MKLVTASAPTMKQMNRSAILSLIRESGDISRSEIAERTGLTKPTVTNLVGELLEEGLVVEWGRGESTGGRKPVYLRLNPESRCILGVDVGIHELRIVALDLEARVLVRKSYEFSVQNSNQRFLTMLGDSVENVLLQLQESCHIHMSQVLGIGVGMHGIVDSGVGTAVFAPILKLGGVNIRDNLRARFGVDVLVDNDVRAMAAGERWFGNAKSLDNFIFVNVGVGVGAAIVVQGEILAGISGSAGEIGHVVVEPGGAVCSCGKRGCLETVCSGPALAQRAVAAIEAGTPTLIADLVDGDLSRVTGLTVHEAAERGDVLAKDLFTTAGRHLGEVLAFLINAVNPEAVIIGGGLSRAGRHLFDPILDSIGENALDIACAKLKVMRSSFLSNPTSVGAASMVLRNVFTPAL